MSAFAGRADIEQPTLAYRFYEYARYPSLGDLRSAARMVVELSLRSWVLPALETRFKPPAHLAVRLAASHMTVSQAGSTGSMTPWRES
jgi:hypothetical protein